MLHVTRLPQAARGGDREAVHRVAHRPKRRRVPRDPALRADSGIRQVAAGALPSTAFQTLRGSRTAVLCRRTDSIVSFPLPASLLASSPLCALAPEQNRVQG